MIFKIEIPDDQAKDFVQAFSAQHGYREKLTTTEENVLVSNPETRFSFFKKVLSQEIINFYKRAKAQELKQEASDAINKNFSVKIS